MIGGPCGVVGFIVGMSAAVYNHASRGIERVLGGAGWNCDRLVTRSHLATGVEQAKMVALLYWQCTGALSDVVVEDVSQLGRWPHSGSLRCGIRRAL